MLFFLKQFLDNLDLLISSSVSIFILIVGYLIYRNNSKNLTNILIFFYAILSTIWGFLTYFILKINDANLFLWILRCLLGVAVLINFITYLISIAYPQYKIDFRNKKFYFLSLITLFSFIIVFTPLTFRGVEKFILNDITLSFGMGIFLFGFISIFLNILFFINLFKKIFKADENQRKQYIILILGFFLTFILIIIFNFILPNFFHNRKFIAYGSVFMFPFIISISYGIIRLKLFNIKLISVSFFIIILLTLNVINLFQSNNILDIILRVILLFVLILFSLFLINAVYIEVEQKEQLAELNKKLEDLNRLKSEFLSFASHQLKSPLAVIKGYSTLISDGSVPNVPDQAKDFSIKIKEAVDKLLDLIEEFMDYRKIEENKMDFNFENVEIVSLIKDFIKNFEILAKDKNLELIFEPSIDNAMVKIDKTRFMQVIQNLFDNAIKYTPSGWVKVGIKKEDSSVLICVCDSGLGMSKELQEKLFGQFVRDPAIKKEIRGTGLGLYIAKNIIEAHNGKIWAESEGEGKGSKFFVKIPLIES